MTSYAARPWLVATLASGALAGAVTAVRTPLPGRFLFVVLAVAAGAEALRCALLRPTLRAHAEGIEVVTGISRERIPWSAVEEVTPMSRPESAKTVRRRADALEIDLGDRLVIVPAYRLGTSAATAASEISALSRTTS
ncbi:MAG TPA: PH domain-containing protein [Mycobacteriales bacterium]|jgi:enhancing lycopene biosynthesis protein 2